ncbi:hypothetical protein FOHLNKBM_5901 [Methylobacterium longum]|nr:hypothetical protein FOHLNKBM_5901 [Methylobacterium longum]
MIGLGQNTYYRIRPHSSLGYRRLRPSPSWIWPSDYHPGQRPCRNPSSGPVQNIALISLRSWFKVWLNRFKLKATGDVDGLTTEKYSARSQCKREESRLDPLGFAARSTFLEPRAEGPERRASPDRGQRSHVQHALYRCSPNRDGCPAPHQARIAVDRRDADESCELVASDGAEFRQLSQKGARVDVADPGNGLEQRPGFASNGRSLDGLADITVELCELLL